MADLRPAGTMNIDFSLLHNGCLSPCVSRDEAISEGWFGPVHARFASQIGDVVAACAGQAVVVASRAEPREAALVGMHGSLASSDQLVPLLTYGLG